MTENKSCDQVMWPMFMKSTQYSFCITWFQFRQFIQWDSHNRCVATRLCSQFRQSVLGLRQTDTQDADHLLCLGFLSHNNTWKKRVQIINVSTWLTHCGLLWLSDFHQHCFTWSVTILVKLWQTPSLETESNYSLLTCCGFLNCTKIKWTY